MVTEFNKIMVFCLFGIRVSVMGIYIELMFGFIWVKAYTGPSSKRGKDIMAHSWPPQTLSIKPGFISIR